MKINHRREEIIYIGSRGGGFFFEWDDKSEEDLEFEHHKVKMLEKISKN